MIKLRAAKEDELQCLSDLCMRSKAVWGYDAAFMAACKEELTVTPEDLRDHQQQVAEDERGLIGLVEIAVAGAQADLSRLFVEPDRLGSGAGRVLFEWAAQTARALGAKTMTIEADPDAAGFYRHMGAQDAGTAPSCSIPGRMLPRLTLDLSGR